MDSAALRKAENPIFTLFAGIAQGQREQNGSVHFPGYIGVVMTRDTGLLGQYLRLDFVNNKFPSNLKFMYGVAEDNTGAILKDRLSLYAIKTLDNGIAKLEGEHVTTARQDYDEKGKACN